MNPRRDLTGQRFGTLLAVEMIIRNGYSTWRCRCDCGRETIVRTSNLKRAKSCGCLKNISATRHGEALHGRETPEYRAWVEMRRRCKPNLSREGHSRYFDRGITVCKRWQSSFEAFVEDMGRRPSAEYSLDRIDNNGNYEPGNCRWATRIEQARNTRPRHRDERGRFIRPAFRPSTAELKQAAE